MPPWSCEAYYEFGSRNNTGYDAANPVPLECEDIPETERPDVFYSGVVYGCSDTEPERVRQGEVHRLHSASLAPCIVGYLHCIYSSLPGFTRKCHAQPSGPGTDYTCYDMAAGTDFQPFVNEVTGWQTSGNECKDNVAEEGFPRYSYDVILESDINAFARIQFLPAHNGTTEFNEDYAQTGPMYSSYKVSPVPDPTPAPTPSPTSEPMTLPPSMARSNTGQVSLILTLGVALIRWMV